MKKHPTLFNGEMVRAILEKRKTNTRRPISRLKGFGKITELQESWIPGCDWAFRNLRQLWTHITHTRMLKASPFGAPGDTLWVRECWGITAAENRQQFQVNDVLHGEWQLLRRDLKLAYHYRASENYPNMCWRPSIHMPRWASRIDLLVKRVWIEHVQDISEADAIAEGADAIPSAPASLTHRTAFRGLWDSIYARGEFGWAANPLVFACEFELIEHESGKEQT